MKMELFSIYDVKTQIYQPPLFCHNSGHALRMVTDAMRNPDSTLGRYPADFLLYQIGDYDDQNGLLTALKSPKQVIAITDLVQMESNPCPKLS